MEIRDYSFSYLDIRMKSVGESFDFAVNKCKLSINEYFDLFALSKYSYMIENDNPKVIPGMSGIELVLNILNDVNYNKRDINFNNSFEITKEYWCGWILAYYQYKTGYTFKFIRDYINGDDLLILYKTLHEASEDKFVDTLNNIINNKIKTTRLQALRKARGYTQSELANISGVNLRTLQEYETGAKDINKISLIKGISLSKALKCNVEDIIDVMRN